MDIFENILATLQRNERVVIVFFGDSTVSCEWIHPNWREIVEYVLKEELSKQTSTWEGAYWNLRCFTAGFSGADSRDLITLCEKEVLPLNPDIVCMLATGNDLERKTADPVTHAQNISTILHMITSSGAKVVYAPSYATSNNEYNESYYPYVKEIEEIFPLERIELVDLYDAFLTQDLEMFFTLISPGNEVVGIKKGEIDYLHVNVLGNAYIAKMFLEKGFGIPFDNKKYMAEISGKNMFPSY